VSGLNRPAVLPLTGINGVKLTDTTIRQNLTDAETQIKTLCALKETFRPDGMFVLMDLTVEAEALGLPIKFEENDTPSVSGHDIKTLEDLETLKAKWTGNGGRMDLFTDVVRGFSAKNEGLTGAYVIGPFTLAGELMGSSELTMSTILDPDLVTAFLEFSVDVITDYTRRLFEAGADMVCMLEPTAMMISPDQFEVFSLEPFKRIQERVDHKPLILHICGNTSHLIEKMGESGAAGLSLDWQIDMVDSIQKIPEDMLLIGNLDPVQVFLQGNPESVKADTRILMEKMKPYRNFVASSGCDLPLETPQENIAAFMEAAVAEGCEV
jgi:uroporphyrinogen decarboxylase